MKKLLLSLILVTSFSAVAADDVCTKLIPDITHNYDVANLKVMRNGNPRISQDLVSCTYSAVTPAMSGDLPVTVTALLNTSNHRFTVEIR